MNLKRGAFLMVCSVFLFSVMSVFVKYTSARIPPEMVVFFRNSVGLLFLAPFVLRHGFGGLRTRYFSGHFTRALWGLSAMYCSFYSVAHMKLADALLLNYTSPLFIPLLAHFMLKEKFPRTLWLFLTVGFVGVLLALRPGAGLFQPVALVALTAGLFSALAQVNIRHLTNLEPVTKIVFYFAVIATVVSALPLPFVWVNPPGLVWGALFLMGGIATAAQILLTRSFASSPAARVGPFVYAAVLFGGVWDWLFWRQLPDVWSVFGALLIVLAGCLILNQGTSSEVTATSR